MNFSLKKFCWSCVSIPSLAQVSAANRASVTAVVEAYAALTVPQKNIANEIDASVETNINIYASLVGTN